MFGCCLAPALPEAINICVNQSFGKITKVCGDYRSREMGLYNYNEILKEICLYLHIAWCPHCGRKPEAITNCIMNKFYLFAIKSIQHLWVNSKFSALFSLNSLPVSTWNAPTGVSSNKAVQDNGQWVSHLIGQNRAHHGESWALERSPRRSAYDYT